MPAIKAGVTLPTVREGVKLLSGVLKKIDAEGNGDAKVSRGELKNFIDGFGDGASMDAALNKVYRYAQKKYDVSSPSISELNKALSDAMKGVAKGDTNKSGNLSPTEQKAIADTWKAVADFSKDYKGSSVRDLMGLGSAP